MIEIMVDGKTNRLERNSVQLQDILPLYGLGADAVVVIGSLEMTAQNAKIELRSGQTYELRTADYHRTQKILSGEVEPTPRNAQATTAARVEGQTLEESETEEVVRLMVYKTKNELVDGGKAQHFASLPPKKKLRYVERIIDINPATGESSVVWEK